MLLKLFLGYTHARRLISARETWSLQLVLWALWTLAVVVTGYLNWHAGVDLGGVVIRSVLVGILGLVVMTKIEMHYQRYLKK
jgi:hypothetical protein